ncbi:unnamed protein product [Ixodes persulcatus]
MPPTVKNRQRDPPIFSGSPDTDVHNWMKSYDRASHHNRWDDSFKLANVVFFLKDTALQWFDNHEDEISSWDALTAAFSEAFGKPERRKQQAKDKLARRFQATTESSTSYIEDVLRLCTRVDADITEEDRIRHLFKGLSQDLFAVVAPKSPTTVQQLIGECKKYEELQSARISKAPFERLPEVSVASVAGVDLPALIRSIIREELRSFLDHLRPPSDSTETHPQAQSVQKVVQNELHAALASLTPSTSTYASPPPPPPLFCTMSHDAQHFYPGSRFNQASPASRTYAPRRRSDIWRTEDQRPICFNCCLPGHVARYCRRRMNPDEYCRFPQLYPRYSPDDDSRPVDRQTPASFSQRDNRRGRSPSPYPRRQRSVSPLNVAAVANTTSN